MRKYLFGVLLPSLSLALPGSAQEAVYPSRPVQIVVPYPAGGTIDPIVRIIANRLASAMGQAFVVVNQPGAGGSVGAANVAHGAQDGYTLLTTAAAIAINATYQKNLSFNMERDLVPVALIARFPMVFVAQPALGIKSVSELTARAKVRPDDIVYGTTGNGVLDHVIAEHYRVINDLKMHRIGYTGVPSTFTALLRGDVHFFVAGGNAVLPFVQAKTVTPLAVTSRDRSPLFPDVPTMREQGYDDFVMYGWGMVMAPSGTPKPVLERLHREIGKALGDADVQKLLRGLGAEAPPMSLDQLRDFMQAEKGRYAEIITRAGMGE